jgi:hypothetical protein
VEGVVRALQALPGGDRTPVRTRDDPNLPPLPYTESYLPRVSISYYLLADVSPIEGRRRSEVGPSLLQRLVSDPGSRDGQMVVVVGQFGGANLFGDLPSQSRRRATDWVLRHDDAAIWVVGKSPKGEGFHLDVRSRGDCRWWLEVRGKPETVQGITYLRARSVSMTRSPDKEGTGADSRGG